MEAENNKGTVNIDIQDEDQRGNSRLIMNREPESWMAQLRRGHEPTRYKNRKTSTSVSIYRVPETIKKGNPAAYNPLVVFLGPLNQKKYQQLTPIDEYKLQAVDGIVQRIPDMTREGLVLKVKELEKDIRDCYEDSAIEWDGDDLAWIMTMDACFILEFLRMDLPDSSLIFSSERSDNVKRREIMMDILKMENQIPLCILKRILHFELKHQDQNQNQDQDPAVAFLAEKLDNCVGSCFRGFPFKGRESAKDKNEKVISAKDKIEKVISAKDGAFHLLDLSRRVIADLLSNPDQNGAAVPSTESMWDRHLTIDTNIIPSAKNLQEAGIKLEWDKEGKVHFERRFFLSSKLHLPRISIYDSTEIFLRNLIALEECQRQSGSQKDKAKRAISRHVRMMNQLIDSKEDVELFREAKIIKNLLGSDQEVATMFNALCVEITEDNDFKDLLEDVNRHYNSKVKVWVSEFRKEHCSSPWYVISLVAAVILLVLTLLQTIYTMESYFAS